MLLAGESLLKKDMHAAMDKTRQHTGRRKGEKNRTIISNLPMLSSNNKDNIFLDTKKKYYTLQLHCAVLC